MRIWSVYCVLLSSDVEFDGSSCDSYCRNMSEEGKMPWVQQADELGRNYRQAVANYKEQVMSSSASASSASFTY